VTYGIDDGDLVAVLFNLFHERAEINKRPRLGHIEIDSVLCEFADYEIRSLFGIEKGNLRLFDLPERCEPYGYVRSGECFTGTLKAKDSNFEKGRLIRGRF
jgi:hypothetical protein